MHTHTHIEIQHTYKWKHAQTSTVLIQLRLTLSCKPFHTNDVLVLLLLFLQSCSLAHTLFFVVLRGMGVKKTTVYMSQLLIALQLRGVFLCHSDILIFTIYLHLYLRVALFSLLPVQLNFLQLCVVIL